ncbi:MAG: DUF4325 domain-containing protein [Parcubacteria group bacterium]|nr:DUF4325 domain-containing protein [Parcubacteria group bacterium]
MDKNTSKIEDFIISHVEEHSSDLVRFIAEQFGFSRQRAHAYVAREIKKGKIIKMGQTISSRYFLVGGKHVEFDFKIEPGLAEDRVWSTYVKPMILLYPNNIQRICNYGFTEIFNNAIDHSEGTSIFTDIEIKDDKINMVIMDNGIGIFQKIYKALNLSSIREAILHLSKGKFTTDPPNHTGEGIFFTSRMFDSFSILSDDMFYTFRNRDWFLSSEKREDFGMGTYIRMVISINSTRTTQEIFDQFSNQEIGFGKTIVAVALSADPDDPHISRSQAKRLLVGLEKFRQIVLDFKGVNSVGQAFVDEVFRVFKNEHPNIEIQYFNANEEVEAMIKRGLATRN